MGLGVLIAASLAVTEHVPVDVAGAAAFQAEHAGHPAAKRWREAGLPPIYAAQYALLLGEDFKPRAPIPPHFAKLEGWNHELRELSRGLRRRGTAKERRELRALLAREDLETPLVKLLGFRPWRRWAVVVSHYHENGAAWVVEHSTGLPDVYVVMKPPFPEGEDLKRQLWLEPVSAALYVALELCRPRLALAGGETALRERAVGSILRRLGVRGGGPEDARMDAVLAKPGGDLVERSSELFGVDCPAPPDVAREGDTQYARRLGWYRP